MDGQKPKIEEELDEFFASFPETIPHDEPEKEEDGYDTEIRKLLAEF